MRTVPRIMKTAKMWISFLYAHLFFFIQKVETQQIIYTKAGSVMNLTCPDRATTESLVWRGPPKLTTYSINAIVNNELDVASRIQIMGNNKIGQFILSVYNFSQSDAGLYRCETAKAGLPTQYEIQATIAEPPRNMNIYRNTQTVSDNISIPQGGNIVLQCSVEPGKPATTLSWIRGVTELAKTNSSTLLISINATRENHLKPYICKSMNEFYQLQHRVQLRVEMLPIVKIIIVTSHEIDEGTNLTLTCNVTTNTYPVTIRWRLNSSELIGHNETMLKLHQVSRYNSGIYECIVENSVGTSSDVKNIRIRYKPYIIGGDQTFRFEGKIDTPSNVSVTVYSGTKPEIAWQPTSGGKQGVWKVKQITETSYELSSSIVPFKATDIGVYKARIRNLIGTLDINILLIPFSMNIVPQYSTCNTSQSITFTCSITNGDATGFSTHWEHFYNSSIIRQIKGQMEADNKSILKIPYCDYRDAGTYYCKRQSEITTYSVSRELTVLGPPIFASQRISIANDNITMYVLFHSVPEPTSVLWLYNDKRVTESMFQRKEMTKDDIDLNLYNIRVKMRGFVASLSVKKIYKYDINLFSCQIKNGYGHIDTSISDELSDTYNITVSNVIVGNDFNNKDTDSGKVKNVILVCASTIGSCLFILGIACLIYRKYKAISTDSVAEESVDMPENERPNNSSSHQETQVQQSLLISSPSYEEIDSSSYQPVERRNSSNESRQSNHESSASSGNVSTAHSINKYEDLQQVDRENIEMSVYDECMVETAPDTCVAKRFTCNF